MRPRKRLKLTSLLASCALMLDAEMALVSADPSPHSVTEGVTPREGLSSEPQADDDDAEEELPGTYKIVRETEEYGWCLYNGSRGLFCKGFITFGEKIKTRNYKIIGETLG